jgi:hypothetical protein
MKRVQKKAQISLDAKSCGDSIVLLALGDATFFNRSGRKAPILKIVCSHRNLSGPLSTATSHVPSLSSAQSTPAAVILRISREAQQRPSSYSARHRKLERPDDADQPVRDCADCASSRCTEISKGIPYIWYRSKRSLLFRKFPDYFPGYE